MNIERRYKSFDILLLLAVLSIATFGVLVIGSALHITPDFTPSDYTQQKIFIVTGLILLFAAALIDYQFICKFYILIYGVNLFLLILVLLLPTQGDTEVARWIPLGPLGGIQPSEFTKVFMIIALAKGIDMVNEKINHVAVLSAVFILTLLPVYLIRMQPSLSASLVTLFIMLVVLYVAGISYKYIIAALCLIVPAGGLFFYDLLRRGNHIFLTKIFDGYQMDRFYAWLWPEEYPQLAYQTNQSIQALASGQFSGKGLNQGIINQFNFLPAAQNDFIFAVVGEEFGFLGSLIILGIMLFIILKCFIIAHNSATNLGKLIAAGVGAMFTFQTLVNACVSTGLLPNTGMPFPFLSAGGSSMWASMISIGLVINVGISKQKSIFEG